MAKDMTPVDEIEAEASTLSCGQRLMQLHRLRRVAPSDAVMSMGMEILRLVQEMGMVNPGLYPDLDDGETGGLSMEWSLRMPSGGFDMVSLTVLADCSIRTFHLPDGSNFSEDRDDVPLDEVGAFLREHIPKDDDEP